MTPTRALTWLAYRQVINQLRLLSLSFTTEQGSRPPGHRAARWRTLVRHVIGNDMAQATYTFRIFVSSIFSDFADDLV